jgi:predicted histidine transporter YuiF (NhaC family)
MIPGIIPTVTRFNLNAPYMALPYAFGHDDHSRVLSRFLLEGFFDALDAQYLRFS